MQTEERESLWTMYLRFLAVEFFDEEIYEAWAKATTFYGEEIQAGETVFNVELLDFEKRLWLLADVSDKILEKRAAELRAAIDSAEKEKALLPDREKCMRMEIAGNGIRSLWWAIIMFNHPELIEHQGLAIRRNFKIVKVERKNPFMDVKLIPGPPPPELMKHLAQILPGFSPGKSSCVDKTPLKCETCAMRNVCGTSKDTPKA